MKILRDIPLSLTPEYVLPEVSRQAHKPPPAALRTAVEKAVALSRTLVAPAAIYDDLTVRDVVDGQVILVANPVSGQEKRLNIGPQIGLLAPARQIRATVYTIGPALEAQVRALYQAGQDLLAFALDSVGVVALGVVGDALHCMVEEQAASLQWGVGPALGPGSLDGWPLQGQHELCALLPLEEIGVRLTDQCVLQPYKSASTIVGLGPSYESSRVGSICRYCALAESCWRRWGD